MLEHRKCGLHFLQEKILIYYQISPGGWLQQMAPTKSSNPLWQILGICKSTLHRLFYTRLFVCTKWCYQWLWMYVYLCVAVMLTLLLLPNFVRITHQRKIFTPQISATCTCMYPSYMHLSATCICICCKIIYMCPYGLPACWRFCWSMHWECMQHVHQRNREVNMVSVW